MKISVNDVSCRNDSVKVDLRGNYLNLFPYKIVISKDEFYRDFNAEYESILPELNEIDDEIKIEDLNDNQLIDCCEYLKQSIVDKYFNKSSDDKMYLYALNDWDNVIIEKDNIVILGQAKPINRSVFKHWIYFIITVIFIITLIFIFICWILLQIGLSV